MLPVNLLMDIVLLYQKDSISTELLLWKPMTQKNLYFYNFGTAEKDASFTYFFIDMDINPRTAGATDTPPPPDNSKTKKDSDKR